MSRRLFNLKIPTWGIGVAALSLVLLGGCSGGPSAKELSLLEEKRQAVVTAEKQVAQKKAQKAQLERKLAEKKAAKEALEQRSTATRSALVEME
jgi:hypothetical protein